MLAVAAALLAVAQSPPPKGELIKFEFRQSKVFPGTVRDVTVYVPAQYDGTAPACVHVNQDGVQFKAPEVFDRLIAEKKLPVVVGVFVGHGRVPPADPAAGQDRWNRSFEYDGLGDNYARFLLDELLPHVETLSTKDGRKIRLSKSGNDRSIGGTSSGAIAAFTAAWERPDAFTRVLSGIGTYVGIRGGHSYSTLIRKYEPKPLRVFLEDGDNDLNIYAGDWWMANQAMLRSLEFAGYEVRHQWGKGKHNNEAATKLFPEAIEWLWQGWPEPVKAGKGNPDVQKLLAPGGGWEVVGTGYGFAEGPAANDTGEVVFCDVPKGVIYKVGSDGKPTPWVTDSKKASGAAFGPDGRLYTAGPFGVIAYGPDGKPQPVADGFKGNDLVVLSNGTVYVTDPGAKTVWKVSPAGEKQAVDTGLGFANGLTVTPDQQFLLVADSRDHWLTSYRIKADGTLDAKQKYTHLHMPDSAADAHADGVRCDTTGQVYVATRLGVQMCDQPGRVHAIVPTPNRECSNLCFGGPAGDVLYVTAKDTVYRRKVGVTGAKPFGTPVKPPKPGL
jgi:sugar lactone lactonase YvrE/enterochelin esterase-like enzyme